MYSEKVKTLFLNPPNVGPLDEPTHVGKEGSPGEGNHVVLFLRVEGDRIEDAAFQTHGCPASIASASQLAEMVKGRSVGEALGITEGELTQALGGLPLGKQHCPGLAVRALRKALADAE
jgi:NifU-like protein involved in Fe-S cluster formation